MGNSVISIIIPVYKVEPYLRKCVDSVLVQTYTNLEVILIDDGSPDNCPAICDEYAARDNRVRVIHQQNAGVSAARNAGLDIATGDYIGFVDSDDWIEPDMYETLWRLVAENNVDMAYIDYVTDGGCPKPQREYSGEMVLFTRNEALKAIFGGRVLHGVVWQFIAKRELFSNVRFALNVAASEDTLLAVQLVLQIEFVTYLSRGCYHYVVRDGAAHSSFDTRFSYFTSYDRIEKLISEQAPDLINDCYVPSLYQDLEQSAVAYACGQLTRVVYHTIRSHVRKHSTVQTIKKLKIKHKVTLLAFLAGYRPYRAFVWLIIHTGVFTPKPQNRSGINESQRIVEKNECENHCHYSGLQG